ncbi:MAG: acetyl-CoA carboxylase biotin carboxyl carrier protein subunit [Azoarcus sp.]|nr:MAG: acetyl-CoA carboxylase biotin carboxyl carrier protein subunit [Azoarcus sp.]TVT57126.1 MAG: acetyl-CoA carboxylase biotin carboxyl carrier protein subunit [Azoarcus sp. PHD]
MRNFRITVDGTPYEVSVEELDAVAPSSASPSPAPSPAPVPRPARPAAAATPAAPPPAAAADGGAGDVPSPLAGTVVSVDVAVGQHVTKSQQLVVLEAMKMNTYITAPRDGRITAINVAAGTAVAEGQSLLSIG